MPLVVRGPPLHSLNSSTCAAYVHHQTLKVELLAQNVPTPLCFTTQSPKPKAKHCLLETLPPLAHLKCIGSARPACPDYLAVNLDWRCHFSNFTIRAHHEVRAGQDLVWRWITNRHDEGLRLAVLVAWLCVWSPLASCSAAPRSSSRL